MRLISIVLGLLASLGLTACHTTGPVPASLMDNSDETRAMVAGYLGPAVGRATVEIGPADLNGASSVSVLPPPLSPLETASVAMPTTFNLMMDGEACYAVDTTTGETVMLDGVACEPQSD